MNPEAEELARQFEAAHNEVIAFVETCTERQWTTMVEGEGWTVGVVMHHVAMGHRQMLDWLDHARRGEPITKTAAEIDSDNARHARDFAAVTRAQTMESLERHGADLARCIGGLSPGDLATAVSFGPGNAMAVTARELAPIAARHGRTHLAAARGPLESGTA
jgi:Mycothiol maleylpyruvate isomerase N-terminal domain